MLSLPDSGRLRRAVVETYRISSTTSTEVTNVFEPDLRAVVESNSSSSSTNSTLHEAARSVFEPDLNSISDGSDPFG